MNVLSPLEPDVLAAADRRSKPGEAEVQGEKRFCLALLRDALEVALERIPATPRERDDALGWIRSDSDSPFAFERVCAELGLDPGGIRQKVEEKLTAADSQSGFVATNISGTPKPPAKLGAPQPEQPTAPRKLRRTRHRRKRKPCPTCGALLQGPWREKLKGNVPLGQDVHAVGIVTFRFCTACVTLFVEGRFVGEVRFGSRL